MGSGLLSKGISGAVSEVRESVLARGRSFRSAGLSGREPRSDEGRESAPSLALLTAFARRSCRRELGLLREELRDTCAVSVYSSIRLLVCWRAGSPWPRTLVYLQALLLGGLDSA